MEISPNARFNPDSKATSSKPKSGRRIAKQTRVEKLRAHEEAQAEAEERLEALTEQEIAAQQRLLDADQRVALRQLVRQMKQVRVEAKRAEEEADQRAAAKTAPSSTSKLSGTDTTGSTLEKEQPLERERNIASGTTGPGSSLGRPIETNRHSSHSHGKFASHQRVMPTSPKLDRFSEDIKGSILRIKL